MTDENLEREALALFEAMLEVREDGWDAWINERTRFRPALADRLSAMRIAHANANLVTGGAADAVEEPPAPVRIGAYKITDCIGRGGMGAVYRGERAAGDFSHIVAIKVIKPGLLSETLVERFQRERQLLASLSHPGIAQLYDGGETEDGSPYFIMEYVDGLPLFAWIKMQDPPRAERLRVFREICAAVAFAHRGLVVHRDLTPSNVMITDQGVKLIDFGIARPADEAGERRDSSKGSVASLSLTPGYAAPERLTSSEVTTAADIYSLGKLLERLMPPGPNERELAAIIAKATANNPLARYPTADALSADVTALHDGHPVSAFSGGKRYATAKFIGRHRYFVSAATAALVLLLTAFGFTLLANARAEAALAQSERRFQETRSIAKAMLFDAFDEVSRVPGSTKAREYLARTGLSYLEALAKDERAPIDVQVEAGQGFLRLSQVMGGGQSSQLGRYQDANALLARSAEIIARLRKAHPDDPLVRSAMASLLIEQSGANLYNNNEPEKARTHAREAQALLLPIAAGAAETARIYATAIQAEGDSYGWLDDYAKAREVHQRGEAWIAALPPAIQADRGVMSVRSANVRLLGEAYHQLKQAEPAKKAMEEAVSLNRALVKAAPDDPVMIRKLAISLWRSAIIDRTDKRDQAARAAIEEAVTTVEILRQRDPNDAGALNLFAMTGEVQAQVLADLGRFNDSYAAGERVIAAHRRLVELAGDAAGAKRSMASALRTEGGNFYNGGAYPRACVAWKEAVGLLTGLQTKGQLSDTDRKNALPELQDYLRKACDPPRDGLGEGL